MAESPITCSCLAGIAEEEGAADAVDKKPKFIRQQTPPRVLDRSPFMKRCVKDVRTYAKQGKFTRVLALTYEAASQPQLTAAERLDLFSVTAPLLSREKRYEVLLTVLYRKGLLCCYSAVFGQAQSV